MTRPGPILEVAGLRKLFFGVAAVDDVTFEVRRGLITALIGPNGSGKSTTIDCISGFQQANGGRVLLDGADVTGLPPHRVARAGLVRTFQNVRVYDDLSVTENLLVARQEFDGLRWRDMLFHPGRKRDHEARARQRAADLLDKVGLKRHAASPAGILSYGQRKLVALAASLMPEPKIVVLDEPLAGVNPTIIRQIEDVICALNDDGETFLIVEHNIEFVMRQCDHVIVMDAGRKLVEGDPTLVREDERVLDVYLGRSDRRAMASHG